MIQIYITIVHYFILVCRFKTGFNQQNIMPASGKFLSTSNLLGYTKLDPSKNAKLSHVENMQSSWSEFNRQIWPLHGINRGQCDLIKPRSQVSLLLPSLPISNSKDTPINCVVSQYVYTLEIHSSTKRTPRATNNSTDLRFLGEPQPSFHERIPQSILKQVSLIIMTLLYGCININL